MRGLIATAVILVAFHGVLPAQDRPGAERFQVASVKQSPPYLDRALAPFVGVPQPGTWRVRDTTVMAAIRGIYPGHALSVQVVGAPDWVTRDYYDIEARMNPAATPDEIRQMARALLAERFKLAVHEEQREAPAFVLVTRKDGKLGSGLTSPSVDCAAFRAGGPRPTDPVRKPNADRLACVTAQLPVFEHTRLIPGADMRLTAGDVPIAEIVTPLGNRLGRPVLDRTGLTKRFDIELQFVAAPVGADKDGPSIRTAITEQLGLDLQDGRTTVNVLVIDHIERPTVN